MQRMGQPVVSESHNDLDVVLGSSGYHVVKTL